MNRISWLLLPTLFMAFKSLLRPKHFFKAMTRASMVVFWHAVHRIRQGKTPYISGLRFAGVSGRGKGL